MTVGELMSVIPKNTRLRIQETAENILGHVDLFECIADSSVLRYYVNRHVHMVVNGNVLIITVLKED